MGGPAEGLKVQHEIEALQAYALRWSVLAAWRSALLLRGIGLAPEADAALERARVKLASGCFTACDVACDLSVVEAALTGADASTGSNSVDGWLDLLGVAMSGKASPEQLLELPAVRFSYQHCGISGCDCVR